MASNFYTTFFLLLLISLGHIATDIYLPSLPSIATYFQTNDTQVQMTLFSYLVSFSLAPLIFGPLSDHFGRKKVLAGGILIGIAASVGCLFAPTIQWLITFRFLQGIGLGAVLISSRASVSDLFTGKQLVKQMTLMTTLMPLAIAMAPTLGGVLQQKFHWQAVFLFLIFYMFLILILVNYRPESLKKQSHRKISQIFSTYRIHLKNYSFIVFGISFILPALGMFAYLSVSPFLFQEVIGLSPAMYGSLSLYIGGSIMTTGYINLKLVKYFSVTQILCLGAGLMLLSGFLLLTFHMMGILTTWSLLLPTLMYFSCLPLCISNAASKAMSQVYEHFGAATALLTTFQFLTGALGSLIFSFVSDETAFSLAICFIVVGALSFINLIFAFQQEKAFEE